jgi:hypothetical protein
VRRRERWQFGEAPEESHSARRYFAAALLGVVVCA